MNNNMTYTDSITIRHALRKKGEIFQPQSSDHGILNKIILCDVEKHRVELVNNRYYMGVINCYDLTRITDNYQEFFIWEMFNVENNSIRIYSPCGDDKVNIIILYDKDLSKWTFYSYEKFNHICNMSNEMKKSTEHFLVQEDRMNSSSFYDSLNEMMDHIVRTYICKFCFYREVGFGMDLHLDCFSQTLQTSRACFKNPKSRYGYVWKLKDICAFFIQNMFFKYKDIIASILPPQIFKYIIESGGSYPGKNIYYSGSDLWF